MEKKKLGKSTMEITRIGLGAWAIGGPWKYGWGQQEDSDSIKTIHRALELGINWIDTAPAYGLGHSEEIICRALKQSRHKPFIFTKCGIVWNTAREPSFRIHRASIEKEIEDSLKRLEVDVIDLYQIHWPNPEKDIEEAWTTLADLKRKGKVRYIGLSNFSVNQIKKVAKISEITSLQPPYSLLDRDAANEILPFCLENSIGVINYSPMAAGLLAGKMSKKRMENLPADDWRRKNDLFREPKFSQNLQFVDHLKAIARDHSCSVGEVAIAWTLAHPAVTAAIVGMRRPDQVDGVIRAAEIKLTENDLQNIDRNLPDYSE